MKEISQKEYGEFRGHNFPLIGRLKKNIPNSPSIYFQIEEDQKSFSCTEILDTLTLSHLEINDGEYEVMRHWTLPEVKIIQYSIPK